MDVLGSYTMGSDHFPILSRFSRALQVEEEIVPNGFNFKRADWNKFNECLIEIADDINSEGST